MHTYELLNTPRKPTWQTNDFSRIDLNNSSIRHNLDFIDEPYESVYYKKTQET